MHHNQISLFAFNFVNIKLDIFKFLILMQLEGPKRNGLNHSIIDYIKSIMMTSDEYLQALEEKTIKKKNQGM